jgi:hypothetical protein
MEGRHIPVKYKRISFHILKTLKFNTNFLFSFKINKKFLLLKRL